MTSKHTMSGVKVRELEWKDGEARSDLGDLYSVHRLSDSVWTTHWNGTQTTGWESTFEAAMAVAQADYERRILSALAPSDAEPVGWLVKDYADGWFFVDKESERRIAERQGHGIRPVYTHPDSSSEAVRALEAIAGYATIPHGDWRRKYPELARMIDNAKGTAAIVDAICAYAESALKSINGEVKK